MWQTHTQNESYKEPVPWGGPSLEEERAHCPHSPLVWGRPIPQPHHSPPYLGDLYQYHRLRGSQGNSGGNEHRLRQLENHHVLTAPVFRKRDRHHATDDSHDAHVHGHKATKREQEGIYPSWRARKQPLPGKQPRVVWKVTLSREPWGFAEENVLKIWGVGWWLGQSACTSDEWKACLLLGSSIKGGWCNEGGEDGGRRRLWRRR